MRILSALMLGYYFFVGRVGGDAGVVPGGTPVVPTGMTAAARAELDRAVGVAAAELAPREVSPPLRKVTLGGRVISIPEGCRSVEKPYNLVIHFHGAPTSMEPAFEKSGIGGVLAILNLGIGSGKYEDAFQAPSAYPELLRRVSEVVREMCPGADASGRFKHVALSAWSAGYGSVWRILDRQNHADQVDAVLLADGLHAGFEPDGERTRTVNSAQMAAFALYADRAASGEKLFAITHSSILTPYASTTETSSYLLEQENVARVALNAQGPRANMMLISRGDRGNFHVQGYAGNDKPDHCDHLHAIGDTLFPYLRERWSR
ncbi:MAG TPA: hypothetical protein VFQ61_10170 [Polyangiaceae bacterium]|nr:hypothetical protein [Polyangiaceae bacterium]